jgi:lipid A 3-O-deacylase
MKKVFFIGLLIIIFASRVCLADEGKKPGDYKTFTFYWENDIINGTDLQYTNGMKLTWISEDISNYKENKHIPKWSYPIIERLPFINEPGGFQKNISFSIGQNIYTPDDTRRTDLIKDDRPYAGISYASIGFISKNTKRMDTIEVDGGIVGPHSYADKVQNDFHKFFGERESKGWDNQLKDEIIFNLFFERKWRALFSDLGKGLAYDLIPHAGFAAGNMLTAGALGGQMRFGLNLPNDFGTLLIRPGSDTNAPTDEKDPRLFHGPASFGIHLFFGVDAFLIGRNILLDGNTFKESHSVDKNPAVCRFIGGLGVLVHHMKFTYSHVWSTKEFKTQKKGQQYGSLTISYSY